MGIKDFGGLDKDGSQMVGVFHGKSHRSKWTMTGGTPMTSWNPPDETAGFTHFPIFPSRFLRPFCEAFCENIRKEDPQSVWRPPEGAKMGEMGGFWRMEDPSIHGKSINGGFLKKSASFQAIQI